MMAAAARLRLIGRAATSATSATSYRGRWQSTKTAANARCCSRHACGGGGPAKRGVSVGAVPIRDKAGDRRDRRVSSSFRAASTSTRLTCVSAAAAAADSASRRARAPFSPPRDGSDGDDEAPSSPLDGEPCPGCGITLQSLDADAPGFYQMPESKASKRMRALRAAVNIDTSVEEEHVEERPEDDVLAPEEEQEEEEEEGGGVVVCARCFSLVNYGRVKNVNAEPLLPSFDVDALVERVLSHRNTRLRRRKPVFVVVVDVMDFEGSLLDGALHIVQEAQSDGEDVGLILCVNKMDLLPSSVPDNRLREWIHRRCSSLGLERPQKTCLVSAASGAGLEDLLAQLEALTAVHSDVFLVGSQNAGKSSLINAMALMTSGQTVVTVAEMPGTTVTPVMLDSSKIVIPNRQQCRIFDTPGAVHAYSVTTRLSFEENKLLLGGGRHFSPRTFRIGAGQSVLASSLLQVDVVECSAATIYVTLWLSPAVTTFMGKTLRANVHRVREAGKMLVPPLPAGETGKKRKKKQSEKKERALDASPTGVDSDGGTEASVLDERTELGGFVKRRVPVEGNDWHKSTTDIAIAGMGWVAIGINGSAVIDIGTYEGVGVRRRASLLPEYAANFNTPGFDRVAKPKAKKRKPGR